MNEWQKFLEKLQKFEIENKVKFEEFGDGPDFVVKDLDGSYLGYFDFEQELQGPNPLWLVQKLAEAEII